MNNGEDAPRARRHLCSVVLTHSGGILLQFPFKRIVGVPAGRRLEHSQKQECDVLPKQRLQLPVAQIRRRERVDPLRHQREVR